MNIKYLSIAATVAGLGVVSPYAEIKLTDNLSASGFLDMSAVGANQDDGVDTLLAGFDQFELDLMFKFGDKVSARADISQGGVGGGQGAIHLEQGFVTAHLGGLSISTGRFLSTSGWEAAEPTGLYQYSYSVNVGLPLSQPGPQGSPIYGGYQNGVNIAYSTPMFGLYGAVVTDLWNTGETDLKTPGFEGQVSVMPIPGLTAKVAYLFQMYDEDVTDDASQQLLNAWASYAAGPITVAAEYNLLLDWSSSMGGENDETGNGYLLMANYKFTDIFAATLRHSGMMYADFDPFYEITVSPSVAISANWLALAEFRYDILPDDAEPIMSYAIESLFYF